MLMNWLKKGEGSGDPSNSDGKNSALIKEKAKVPDTAVAKTAAINPSSKVQAAEAPGPTGGKRLRKTPSSSKGGSKGETIHGEDVDFELEEDPADRIEDEDLEWETEPPKSKKSRTSTSSAAAPSKSSTAKSAAAKPSSSTGRGKKAAHPKLEVTMHPSQQDSTPTRVYVDPEVSANKPAKRGGGGGSSAYRAMLQRGGPPMLGQKPLPKGSDDCLAGLSFVLTGVLESLERDMCKQLVEHYGGKVMSNVGKTMTHFVVGTEPGLSKVEKVNQMVAAGAKIETLDEDGLFALIESRSASGEGAAFAARDPKKRKSNPPLPVVSVREFKSRFDPEAPAPESTPRSATLPDVEIKPVSSQKPPLDPEPGLQQKQSAPVYEEPLAPPPSPPPPSSGGQALAPAAVSHGLVHVGQSGAGSARAAAEKELWAEKYRPVGYHDVVGNNMNLGKLQDWLKLWTGPKVPTTCKRAVLLSGPPGIGKTSMALVVCRELQFEALEMNASDTRSKNMLRTQVQAATFCRSVQGMGPPGGRSSGGSRNQRMCLIMDEVDGMSGGDRGGGRELIDMIQKSKVPIICICNDRASDKVRSLANYCLDLRFSKPTTADLTTLLRRVASRERLEVEDAALMKIAEHAQGDIRQALNLLQFWVGVDDGTGVRGEDIARRSAMTAKNVDIGAVDAVEKMMSPDLQRLSLDDRLNLFFCDDQLIPFYAFENYLEHTSVPGNALDHLRRAAEAAECFSLADQVSNTLGRTQNYSLQPTAAMLSAVLPLHLQAGSLRRRPEFPTILGKISRINKRYRLLQDLSKHVAGSASTDVAGLRLDYVPRMAKPLLIPMSRDGDAGIGPVLEFMESYGLSREDWDTILVEFGGLLGSLTDMHKVETRVKSAFTRAYNQRTHGLKQKASKSAVGHFGSGLALVDEEAEEDSAARRGSRNGASNSSLGLEAGEDDEEDEDEELDDEGDGAGGSRSKGRVIDELVTVKKSVSKTSKGGGASSSGSSRAKKAAKK